MPRGGKRPGAGSGGARPGAGRPAAVEGARQHSLTLRLSTAEYALLDQLQAALSTPEQALTSSDVLRRALRELAERQTPAAPKRPKRAQAAVVA